MHAWSAIDLCCSQSRDVLMLVTIPSVTTTCFLHIGERPLHFIPSRRCSITDASWSQPHAYLFRGNFEGVKVKVAQRTMVFEEKAQASFTTMRSMQQRPVGRKGYYEISLIKPITSPKWGFALERFVRYCSFSDKAVP
jgi:hypothetical protein